MRLTLCVVVIHFACVLALPPSSQIIGDAVKANNYFLAHAAVEQHTHPSCDWTRSTYMIGVMALLRSTSNQSLHDYAVAWGESNNWHLCYADGVRVRDAGPKPIKPKGKDDADNQLCAATYAELYAMNRNPKYIKNSIQVLSEEAMGTKDNYWSWVDAIHMGMNAYSRIGNVTGDDRYFDAMFRFYNQTANAGIPPDGRETFHMWNESQSLFYRDDRFLGTNTFWGRGNGWAITAMARSLEVLPQKRKFDAHRKEYTGKLVAMASALKKIQGADGCWRASLLNATAYPQPETTGSANFVYGLAYGINAGLLNRDEYISVVEKGWQCLSKVSLQYDGLVGYCQPVGGSPASTNARDTSDFCVGQFLLAATQVAELASNAHSMLV